MVTCYLLFYNRYKTSEGGNGRSGSKVIALGLTCETGGFVLSGLMKQRKHENADV